jgi:hypothetical protein
MSNSERTKEINNVKQITHLFFLLAALVMAPLASAADAPMVREIYSCNFNDGKDMDDLMSARDYYLNQMEKADQEPATAFVWTPFKAATSFDFLWANNNDNLMDYARRGDAFNASAEGQASMERFNSVATCTSSLAVRRQMFQAEGELNDGSGGAVIQTFACDYRRGHGPDDLEDLVNHVSEVVGSVDIADGALGFVSVPGVGASANSADLYFYNVNGSLEKWAARSEAFQAAPGTPALMRHLQTVVDCGSALFTGQRVVPPLE